MLPMESNLKNQTQLFTFAVLNLIKVMDTCKEVDIALYTQLQESSKYLNMALNTYLSATSTYRPTLMSRQQEDNAMEIVNTEAKKYLLSHKRKHRQITKHFAHGTKIKHVLCGDEWIGTFNAYKNTIVFREKEFPTLYGFVKEHYFDCQRSYNQVNAWKVCKYEQDGVWLNTANL